MLDVFRTETEMPRRDAARLVGVNGKVLDTWPKSVLFLDEWHGPYRLTDLAPVAVLRELNRASLKMTDWAPVVRHLALPVIAHVERDPRCVDFRGERLSKQEKALVHAEAVAGLPSESYAWAPLPPRLAGDPLASVYLLRDLDDARARTSSAPAGLLLDLGAIAAGIAARATQPLVTYEVKERAA